MWVRPSGSSFGDQMAAHAIGADQHDHAQMIADQRLGALARRGAAAAASAAERLDQAQPRSGCGCSARPGALEQAPRFSGSELVEIGPPARVDRGRIGEIAGVQLLDERAVAAVEEGGLLELASLRHRPALRHRRRDGPASRLGTGQPPASNLRRAAQRPPIASTMASPICGRAVARSGCRRAHRLDLLLGPALAAGDDRAGMAHAPARRGGAAGDEADDRLACSPTPCQNAAASSSADAADLADHDRCPRSRGSARNSSSTSMNLVPLTGSPPIPTQVDWPRPAARGLRHRLVGQRAGARDDADLARPVDVARHDADLALARA